VAQALLTAVGIGLIGTVVTAVFGLTSTGGAEVSRHAAFGIFSTLITLLAHSMMMFYLIGKGKAVKDAMADAGYGTPDDRYRAYVGRIAAARRPVFSMATVAMAVTMAAAILGASVDTGVLPAGVHAFVSYAAVVANGAALKVEIDALSASGRVVDEVNQLLGS
jgi:hypothetical protein